MDKQTELTALIAGIEAKLGEADYVNNETNEAFVAIGAEDTHTAFLMDALHNGFRAQLVEVKRMAKSVQGEIDRTQGPACAVAAGAGTIYRNYFADVNGQIGQSSTNQIDCLKDVGDALGNHDDRLWKMQNGYALPPETGLGEISSRIGSMTHDERDELRPDRE